MTCPSQRLGQRGDPRRLRALLRTAIAICCLYAAAPAEADVGAAVSVFNDARFRGFSISDHHPVGLVDLSYDDASGAYLAASGTAVASSDGVHPLALIVNGGLAKRLQSGITIDAGIVHSEYSHYSSALSGRSYTEVYGGVSRKSVSGRLYFSPHYFGTGHATLYGELDNNVGLARKLRLQGHVGLLVPLRGKQHPILDWRLGLTRQFGRISLHAAWAGAAGRRYDDTYSRSSSGFVFGASYAF